MSQQKKKRLRRKLAQCVTYQQKTIENLLEVAEIFGEFHDDYKEMFEVIATSCGLTLELIKRVCEHAWGYFPNDFHTWLQ
jgi:hypothetical protein